MLPFSIGHLLDMASAFRLFLAIVLIAPAFLMSDATLPQGMLMAGVALTLFVITVSLRPGEAAFFSSMIRPYGVAAALFAAVILLQLAPMPVDTWRHPIWLSAEAALGGPVWGSITISPGDTVIALFRFLTFCGLLTAATAVSIDRRRAEILLFILLAVSTGLALVLAVHNSGGFVFLGEIGSTGPRAAIALASSIATVLALTTLVYAVERFETRHGRTDFGQLGHVAALTAAIVCFVVAAATVTMFMAKAQWLAMLMGLGTMLLIIGFRRAGVSAKFGFLIPLATLGIAVVIGLQAHGNGSPDIALRFAADTTGPHLETAQRILSDIGWLGSGAGTFADIAPLYGQASAGQVSQQAELLSAPTTIAASIIGFGRPLTWAILAGAVLGIVRLVYGALGRGRDSFFTAAAASCLVAALVEAFIDTSLLHSAGLILVSSVLGLGVAQSASRTAR